MYNHKVILTKMFNKRIRMIHQLKTAVLKSFLKINIGITSASNLSRLQIKDQDTSKLDLEFIKAMSKEHYGALLEVLDKSKSQLRQDLMVLAQTGFKRGGVFCRDRCN